MLYKAFLACNPDTTLLPRDQFKPLPTYADRDAWNALPEEVKAYYDGVAERLAGSDIPPLRASRYMDYLTNGNRSQYEAVYFARRGDTIALMIAECIRGDGSLMEDLIDRLWATCEESSWVIPAHNHKLDKSRLLVPDLESPEVIDLFAAETGSLLSWAYYLLGDALAQRSPVITRRIELEVTRRLLDPHLNDPTHYWTGLASDRPVNNWNPWINSNLLTAWLIIEKDEARRRRGIDLTARSIQRFLDFYHPDGGCDEGPGYFVVAGASLFDYLEEMAQATGGAMNIYDHPLIGNIARYIYRAHIDGAYFVNFADSAARVSVPAGQLERIGQAIGDATLTDFARMLIEGGHALKPYKGTYGQIYRRLRSVFSYQPTTGTRYAAPTAHVFEGVEVFTARENADGSGLFVACKGGHNRESHNHNDVGQFIIYRDGRPVIIDAGVETYTNKTFSDFRYEIWTMRSTYHNLPEINGCEQFPGREAAAKDVAYVLGDDAAHYALDIAGAYPKEACIESYRRSVALDKRAHSVTVEDAFSLSQANAPLVMNLMCHAKPTETAPGELSLGGMTLRYDAGAYAAAIEPIVLTDKKIRDDWGVDRLYRIRLTANESVLNGGIKLSFTCD